MAEEDWVAKHREYAIQKRKEKEEAELQKQFELPKEVTEKAVDEFAVRAARQLNAAAKLAETQISRSRQKELDEKAAKKAAKKAAEEEKRRKKEAYERRKRERAEAAAKQKQQEEQQQKQAGSS